MYAELAVLALFTFAYGLLSERISKLPMSGPILFVLAGLCFGPVGLGWFDGDTQRGELKVMVDLTLALILFIDAANADLRVLGRNWALPARMLALGLPGAIALGSLLALLLFDALSWQEALVVGTMLAATDAALGKAVVTNENVPSHLREGLNAESGLNDGLCVPFLLLFIALAKGDGGESPLVLFAEELGIGAGIGASLAIGAAWLMKQCSARGWINEVWLQLCVPALAFACFSIAQSLHGSGYIAAFVGGMVFGTLAGPRIHKLTMPAEGISEAMAMITWLAFGVLVIGQSLPLMTWQIWTYAALSLTVVRMLPMAIALIGSGTRASSSLFLGWFGPRGLASIVFAIMVLDAELTNSRLMAMIVACTVILSLLLHGITANPLARRLAEVNSRTG